MKSSTVLALAAATTAILFGFAGILITQDLGSGFLAYVIGWAAYSVFGALLGALRPRNPVGWLFAIMGLSSEIGLAADSMVSSLGSQPGGPAGWALGFLSGSWFIAFELIPALLILFPDGRVLSPRWRIVLLLIGLNTVLGTLTSSGPIVDAPIAPALAAILGRDAAHAIVDDLQGYAGLAMMGLFAAGAVALGLRTRRSRGVERQQLKWIAFAAALLALALAAANVIFFSPLRSLDPGAQFPAAMFGGVPFVAALVSVPAAAAIAILRYRLYDVDLLIKRTAVYGATTAAVGIVFFVGILGLQTVVSPLTSGSEVAVAASTLLSFALFQPVRRRIQDVLDQRFDRSRYDAARTLEVFADRLRDEVDLDSLRSDLVGAVTQTMAPTHASLWLRSAPHAASVTISGRPAVRKELA